MSEMVPGGPASMDGLGERLLTQSEVAYLLRVDRVTVRRLTASGKLRKVDFGERRMVRYRPEDVAAFLAGGGL